MGFGILFIGYLITFGSAFFTVYLFADIIGCAVMLAAFLMLYRYHRAFKYTAMSTGLLTFVYGAATVLRLMGYGTPSEEEAGLIGERIYSVIQNYVLTAVTLAFYILLLYAIAKLAEEVELHDIAKRCRNYVIAFAAYSALWVLFTVFSERIAAASVRVYNVTASGLVLFNGIWLIMIMLLIMSCMKWIAPAEVLEAEARGEEGDTSLLTKIGVKLDKIQESARTPREDKEAEKLRHELDRAEKRSSKDDGGEESE